MTDTTTTTTTINKIIKKTANRVEIQFLFIVNPNDQKSVFMALLQVRNGVSTLLTLGVWFLSAIICTGPLSGVYIICLHNVYMKKKKENFILIIWFCCFNFPVPVVFHIVLCTMKLFYDAVSSNSTHCPQCSFPNGFRKYIHLLWMVCSRYFCFKL